VGCQWVSVVESVGVGECGWSVRECGCGWSVGGLCGGCALLVLNFIKKKKGKNRKLFLKKMNEIQIQNIMDTFKEVGFKHLKAEQLRKIAHHYTKASGKIMMIISHSSNHDFLLGLLLFGHTQIPTTMFTDFKNPFLTMFARNIGMITREQGVPSTSTIINELKKKKNYAFLISLARTARQQKVHSGYFYIAQALQIPMIVLGFDYFLQTGYVSEKHWAPPQKDLTYEQFQKTAEQDILHHLQQICPFKPNFQVGFDMQLYKNNHADFDVHAIRAPSLTTLYYQVAGNCIPTSTWVTILVIVVVILLICLIIYLCFSPTKK